MTTTPWTTTVSVIGVANMVATPTMTDRLALGPAAGPTDPAARHGGASAAVFHRLPEPARARTRTDRSGLVRSGFPQPLGCGRLRAGTVPSPGRSVPELSLTPGLPGG